MQSDDPTGAEERLVSLLEAYDEALAAGRTPAPETAPDLPQEMRRHLRWAQAGLERLARHRRSSVADAVTIPPLPGPQTGAAGFAGGWLGRFEVRCELGRGGHGIVFLAFDPLLRREVALKVPRLEASLDPGLLRRFLREARAAAGLDHPNLVPVHEAGETGPFCYIVSAYCRGDTLAAWLRGRRAPVPPRAAAALVAALADGVEHVHGRGILHRDIKPGNVLLEPVEPGALEGLGVTPRLTDFGLVKLVASDTQQTASGALVGTPRYMAPEQAAGQLDRVGPHTDVYALGAVLYEVLTGRPAFEAASVLDTLEQVRAQEPVRPGQLRPGVPRDLETICLHCLHKEPLRRYASARALVEDLRRFLRGEPVLARRVGRLERLGRWVKRRPAVAALAAVSCLAVVALLGLGFWFSAQVGAARGALDGARQVADTERFFGLLHAVEKRSGRPEPGWTWANLEDLHRAASLPAAAEHVTELRSEATEALGAIDVRPARVVGQGFEVDSLAFHPRGRWLALGGTNVEQQRPCTVRLIDLEGKDGDRSLSFEARAAWDRGHDLVPDGVRSLAFSSDGRWLVAGARSGWIHRWDLAQPAPACASWAGHAAAVKWLLFSTDGGPSSPPPEKATTTSSAGRARSGTSRPAPRSPTGPGMREWKSAGWRSTQPWAGWPAPR